MTAAERLGQKRAALAQAEAVEQEAALANDVPRVIAAKEAIAEIRAEIGKLLVETQRETETDARSEAPALIKTLRQGYEDAVAQFAADTDGLEEQLRKLTPVVQEAFERWSSLDWRRRELAVVARRFELPDPTGALTPLPTTPDMALAVFDVAARSNVRPSPQPIYGHVANFTPEQKHAADVVALGAYVKAHRRRFSPATVELFAKVPVADLAPPDPRARERNEKLEREERDHRRMRERADAEAKAMTAIRSFDTDEAKKVRELKRAAVARAEASTRTRIVEEKRIMENTTPGKGPLRGLRDVPATNKKKGK